jgi:hypothetical protein
MCERNPASTNIVVVTRVRDIVRGRRQCTLKNTVRDSKRDFAGGAENNIITEIVREETPVDAHPMCAGPKNSVRRAKRVVVEIAKFDGADLGKMILNTRNPTAVRDRRMRIIPRMTRKHCSMAENCSGVRPVCAAAKSRVDILEVKTEAIGRMNEADSARWAGT